MSGNIYTNIVAHNVREGNYGGVNGAWGNYANADRKGPFNPFKIYSFDIKDGKVFEATDSNGLSDPYIKFFEVKKNEKGEEEKKLIFKTSVSKKTLQPIWNYTGVYAISSKVEKAYIELWDDDLIRDDFIGRCKIKLSEIDQYDPFKDACPMHNDNNKQAGMVNVKISLLDYNEENQLKCSNWKKK